MTLLTVRDLSITARGLTLVEDLTLFLEPGERLGLVGESGSGKSLTALAIMGLVPGDLDVTGSIRFADAELNGMREKERARLRGLKMSMIFQEPMTALNPVMKVGHQVGEVLEIHKIAGATAARTRAIDLLERVGIPDPSQNYHSYPHQLSGGQRQRVMIAMAVACKPRLLIADEPTTALDVTVQRQILDILGELIVEEHMSLLLISHDMPLVAGTCDRVCVMYGGGLVEAGVTAEIVKRPRHPYTYGLIGAVPPASFPDSRDRRLTAIPGTVPQAGTFPTGCRFRNRCDKETETCLEHPTLDGTEHQFRCWHPLEGDS